MKLAKSAEQDMAFSWVKKSKVAIAVQKLVCAFLWCGFGSEMILIFSNVHVNLSVSFPLAVLLHASLFKLSMCMCICRFAMFLHLFVYF